MTERKEQPADQPASLAGTPSPEEIALAWTHTARFLTTASELHQLPATELREIAFVGRSNAGKSTAINVLTQQRRLAFASKTPGRTQHINLFELGPKVSADTLFADLPGYGYAAVARSAKHRWQKVMADYLKLRRSLAGVVLMVDSRLGFTDLDRQLMEFVSSRIANGSVKLLVLLTKADKLNRTEANASLAAAQAVLGEFTTDEADVSICLFSALKKTGIGDAATLLHGWAPPMIETFDLVLPHGITLSCRASGPKDAPVLVFLHGFPEAAFVWDEMLAHFGSRYRCVAPNLRGYERSSAPEGVEAYRPKHLVADVKALIESLGGKLAALIAHDWGGAVAWNLAVQHPALIERLVIINSPHPATFLRALQTDLAQQAASHYMNLLRSPEAEARLSANDFSWLLARFKGAWGGSAEWLTESIKDQYRSVWSHGLTGSLNYYRASPLFPPTEADDSVMALQFPAEFVTVRVPTWVLWAEEDRALLPSLLDGLDEFVPKLTLVRLPGASHWVVHEQPQRVAQEIDAALAA